MSEDETPGHRQPGAPPGEPAAPVRLRDSLPFRLPWPILAGAGVGLVLRLFFSASPGQAYSAMAGSFILLTPIVVGAVTVYAAERQRRRSWRYYFFAPFLANVLFVVGTLLILIEGWICAILIVPLFATLGGLGGLAMGAICRWTRWPRHATYSIAVLPLLLGAFEPGTGLPRRLDGVERTVVIAAPPAEVWKQIHHADAIRPEEVDRGWMYRIGVPLPVSGITGETAEGRVRRIRMGKGIRFEQVVTEWIPERRVRFRYRFDADSIPPRALDDHVRIGGDYFDLGDTIYTLEPTGDATRLTLRMDYRVSTRFNWYAEPLAKLLIGNFEDTALEFYRQRSEAAVGAAGSVAPTPEAPHPAG
ncbi:SRPBCC domain-containing protein [Luteimonas sp. RD2P54]|uniref:SRPBCC domain-containing protein n=1 Tax=Luteimonas endophytica TaxID=3042023 RepID=A0ABT6JCA6_9GAMM|nr:SRPBCC domain-containing protein [Luteimonas endophytica]MDH5824447.1 SRPBCC domain-containing protein [Luteimonas endophytica]